MRLLITTQAVDAHDPILGFFIRWIEEFAKHCEKVTVVCLRKGTYTLPDNVRVIELGKASRLVRVLRLWRVIVRLRRDYDAVFVHMNPEYILAAGLLWRVMRKRIALWYTHKSVNLYLRLALIIAHRALTASKESFRLASRKVHVMGHGIDVERSIPPHTEEPGVVRLMTSGRVSRVKGLGTLIDAYLALKARGIKVTFSVFGAPVTEADVAYEQELHTRLRATGEAPEKIFVGAVPHADMPKRRAAMDYFLHASETGSLDKAVLDAIRSGVIPLTSSEAYRKLFSGVEQRLYYPKGDSGPLADRIMALEALKEAERARIREVLKDRVNTQHSLQSLIPKIVYILQHA